MTKPFSEPSQGKENAYLGWTANQLLRRPPAAAAFANMSWAWIGTKSVTVPGTGYANGVHVDFDPSDGFFFVTNDPATFENVLGNTVWGISAFRGGVYVAWFYCALSTSHSITHGTKRAWLTAISPTTSTEAAFDIGVITGLNVNNGSTGIDASVQSWNVFDMKLNNIPDSAVPPDATQWGLEIAQESGFDADALPALFVVRLADALDGGIG